MDVDEYRPRLPSGPFELVGMEPLFGDELGPPVPSRQVEVSLTSAGGTCPMSIRTGYASAGTAFGIVFAKACELKGEFEVTVRPA